MSTGKRSPKKTILISFAVLVGAVVLVVHTYFASWLLDYVNKTINTINGYQGSVQSIDIHLYRGAYSINKLVLNKKEGTIPTPFIAIDNVDLSLQWGALFHGRIVSDITLTHPVINFAVKNDTTQDGGGVDWTKPIKALAPIDINHVHFDDGSITYQDFSATPQVNIFIHHLVGEIDNLRNVEDPARPLPSTVAIRGSSIGGGDLRLRGRMNILKPTPDMDIYLALENVDLPALNNYSEAYASFDFKHGSFNLYSQFNVKDDAVSGYVKPVVTGIDVDILKTPNPLRVAWNTVIAGVIKLFSNQTKDQFATRVDLEGNLKNIDTDVWSTLGGIVSNAFIEAMTKGFESTGDKDVMPAKD